jgi:hypothetical protein
MIKKSKKVMECAEYNLKSIRVRRNRSCSKRCSRAHKNYHTNSKFPIPSSLLSLVCIKRVRLCSAGNNKIVDANM